MKGIVYVVHCVDAEGPLYESPEVPFDQIRRVFGINVESTEENKRKLINKEIDFGEFTDAVYNLVDPHKMSICGDWKEIEENISLARCKEFRDELLDSNGKGWIYNWFCLDHVGFCGDNPRRRDKGYHKVFDKYNAYLKEENHGDIIQFHHHPVSHSGNYNDCGTAFWGRSTLNDILTRRVIDREWFPSVYRPGFHTERPDSNWFLEQWIPFDYSNQSVKGVSTDQLDCLDGRFGDWRRAPLVWKPYHPSHDDYQKKGNCRRWLTRCLNMYARLREITQEDVYDAFELARCEGNSILAFTDHDFKDIRFDVNRVRKLIKNAAELYDDVGFVYANAIDAMRKCCKLKRIDNNIKCSIVEMNERKTLVVEAFSPIFGPQPFLALKTVDGRYIWDNFDFYNKDVWTYSFDNDSIPYRLVDKIGVATNNSYGSTFVYNYDCKSRIERISIS